MADIYVEHSRDDLYYTTVKLTEELPLKYSYPLNCYLLDTDTPGIRPTVKNYPLMFGNYTPYELRCFLSKFNHILHSYNKSWRCFLVPKKWNDRVHLFVEIDSGKEIISIDEKLKGELLPYIEYCYNKYPNHVLIFSCRDEITYKGNTYQKSWVMSMLTKIRIPKYTSVHFGEYTTDHEPIYENGNIYMRFDPDSMYDVIQDKISIMILDTLDMLYNEGVIELDPILDSEFITKWRLVPYNNTYGSLYMPIWENTRITRDRVKFLMEELSLDPNTNLMIPLNGIIPDIDKLSEYGFDAWLDGTYLVCDCEREYKNYQAIVELMY